MQLLTNVKPQSLGSVAIEIALALVVDKSFDPFLFCLHSIFVTTQSKVYGLQTTVFKVKFIYNSKSWLLIVYFSVDCVSMLHINLRYFKSTFSFLSVKRGF